MSDRNLKPEHITQVIDWLGVTLAIDRGDDPARIAHGLALTSPLSHAGAVQIVTEIQALRDDATRRRWVAIAAVAEVQCLPRVEVQRAVEALERQLARPPAPNFTPAAEAATADDASNLLAHHPRPPAPRWARKRGRR